MKKKSLLLLSVFLCLFFSCSKEEVGLVNNENDAKVIPSELVTLKSGVVVEKRGDQYFLEGDILLAPNQLSLLEETGTIIPETNTEPSPDTSIHPLYNLPKSLFTEGQSNTKALGIYPTSYNMWAMVRFTYNKDLPYSMAIAIRDALYEIEAATNIRFYNATGQPTRDPQYGFDYPYIEFVYIGNSSTSSSYVGRIGGRQPISLADFAIYQDGVIVHEICHAIGMLHEQSRPDRDTYVNINTSNLTALGKSQFDKRTTNYYYVGNYDFTSVMGYSSYTSSKDVVINTSLPMYTKKDGSSINQGRTVSDNDRKWINSLYIPYIARSDVYAELAERVYWSDNTIMTPAERLDYQAYLNNGNRYPPANGRIANDLGRFK